ncbi:hypothetical protein JCM8547_009125 [Rhodosporidiobolus lusitaniae]
MSALPPRSPASPRPYARSPSPTAPPLIRGPSPLGGKVLVFQDDGQILVSRPQRPVSAPPVQPAGPRPPSPGSASAPIPPPPVQRARRNSQKELQKIDSLELQKLLRACLTDFTALSKALLVIQSRISRQWTVPQRTARTAMKTLVQDFTTIASWTSRYFSAVALCARKLLNYVATSIKHTHGLRDFTATQPLKPLTDELLLLHRNWATLERAEERFGDALGQATLVLEEAMDPDKWTPNSPLTPPIHTLATSHRSLLTTYTSLSTLFLSLSSSPTTWHPPLLSPEDVKTAAQSWRAVERLGRENSEQVGRVVEGLWRKTGEMAFVSKGEGEGEVRRFRAGSGATTMLQSATTGTVTGGAGAVQGRSIGRPMSAAGWRGS